MKRKVFLIILVFLINILWVNAIGVTNKLSEKYNIVINTKNSPTKLAPTIDIVGIIFTGNTTFFTK